MCTNITIEREAALERLGGDIDLFNQTVIFFIEDSADLESELADTLAVKDTQAALRAAHSIKGLASQFGASTVVSMADQIQMCCKKSQPEKASAIFQDLHKALEKMRELLQREGD